jgi:hypothetical protein
VTQIRNLPAYTVSAVVGSNEDWVDSIAIADPFSGIPIDLTGITFHGALKATTTDKASTSIAVTAAGSVITLNVPAAFLGNYMPGLFIFDILATADGIARRVVSGTLMIQAGIAA